MLEPVVDDRFEFLERAGRGGSAVVYRAWDRLVKRMVAVKVFTEDAADSAYVQREVEVLSHLRHPGVVAYFDHGATSDGRAFVVTEWLEGQTLHERLRKGPLTLQQSVRLVTALASALGHAHVRGVIHRDVKPSNIFLVQRDPRVPKLLDFGVARPAYVSAITRAGSIVGTPGYMAPEQARGDEDIDVRVDVFSLGAVLFECLAGRPIFGAGSPVAVLARLLLDEIPRLSSAVPGVPARLDALCAAMLARDPEERPADARAVLRMLEGLGDLVDQPLPPADRPSGALLERERRLFCVVLVGQPEARPSAGPAASNRTRRDTTTDEDAPMPTQQAIPRAAIAAVLERYGFRAVLGGQATVLGVLPLVGIASDQLVQAARCALELRRLDPTTPIAVASGHGIVLESESDSEPLEKALGLLRTAAREAGAVLVDEATAGLLAGRFELAARPEAWALGAERASVARLQGSFMARRRELRRLLEAFEQASEESSPRTMLLTAEAGAGKSRLLAEASRRLAEGGARVWKARGDVARRGEPYGLVRDLLRRAASDEEPDAPSEAARMGAFVARYVPPAGRTRAARLLNLLFRERFEEEPGTALGVHAFADEASRAFADLVARSASVGGLVLVFDDLQWGDVPSLRMMQEAMRAASEQPLLTLAAARPNLRESFPELAELGAFEEIRLAGLPTRDASALVRGLLGDVTADTLIGRIVALADGNVYFLEELARAARKTGVESLPSSLVAMTSARLASQDELSRRVLRGAAVFGDRFWLGGVVRLLGDRTVEEVSASLRLLEEEGIVTRADESVVPFETELAFDQSLLREAAERMTAPADLPGVHAVAAAWLEEKLPSDPLRIARHWANANEARRASPWLLAAAEKALAGGDFATTLDLCERGQQSDPDREVLGRLHQLAEEALLWRGEYGKACARGKDALAALTPASPAWWAAVGTLAVAFSKAGDVESLKALGRPMLEAPPSRRPGVDEGYSARAEASRLVALARCASSLFVHGELALGLELLDDVEANVEAYVHTPEIGAAMLDAIAVRDLSTGDLGGYLTRKEQVVAACGAAGLEREGTLQRVRLGYACMCIGDLPRAEHELRAALEQARSRELAQAETLALHNLGLVLAYRGAVEEGARLESEALAAAIRQGDVRIDRAARLYLARIRSMAGELDAAEEVLAPLLVLDERSAIVAEALAESARVDLARGHVEQALATMRRAKAMLEPGVAVDEGELVVGLVHLEALVANGLHAEARSAGESARARVMAQASRIEPAVLAQTFLERQPEVQRLLAIVAGLGANALS